jgi:hypothetical protein
VVPILVIAVWFLPGEGLEIPQRTFWRTIGILAPVGCLLDVIFAQWFFCFPNPKATLGIAAPALGRPVPIEEYFFYLTGFITILLLSSGRASTGWRPTRCRIIRGKRGLRVVCCSFIRRRWLWAWR